MSSGWVSIHRSITDHWIWENERFTKAQAWIDLLLNANHSDKKTMIKGRLIEVKRGQQIRSISTLSRLWKWNSRTVKGFLNALENDAMIAQQSTQLTTTITICKYNDFQENKNNSTQQNTQRTTQQSTQAVHSRLHTNNNVNNVNNKQLDYSSWPQMPSEQTMIDWLAMRKRLRANVSQTVVNNFAKQLNIAVKSGYTVDGCLSECVTRNWRGFKAEWLNNEKTISNNRSNLTAVERVVKAGEEQERREREKSIIDITPHAEALGEDDADIRA